jgi:hypothetical protein
MRSVHVKGLSPSSTYDLDQDNLTVCGPVGRRARRLRLLSAGRLA